MGLSDYTQGDRVSELYSIVMATLCGECQLKQDPIRLRAAAVLTRRATRNPINVTLNLWTCVKP